MKKNLVAPSFILAVAVFSLIVAIYELDFGNFAKPGPGFLPCLASIGIIFLCILRIIKTFSHHDINTESPIFDSGFFKVLGLTALIICYALILEYLGFYISTFIALLIMFHLYEPMNFLYSIVASIFIPYIFLFTFGRFLSVELPRGIMPHGFLGIF